MPCRSIVLLESNMGYDQLYKLMRDAKAQGKPVSPCLLSICHAASCTSQQPGSCMSFPAPSPVAWPRCPSRACSLPSVCTNA